MWMPSPLSKNPTAAAAPAGKGEAPYYENAMMTSLFEGGAATKMHSFDIRDFRSNVIWFYVLTFLETPKTCAEIKKTNYF
jgi:hypothetical protein